MATNECEYAFFVTIDGRRYDISRSVTHDHPAAVHKHFETRSEGELQQMLDQFCYDDWYDDGKYQGPDAFGLEVERFNERAKKMQHLAVNFDTREVQLIRHAQEIVARHKPGCSCGSPDCPQFQADQLGVEYEPEAWVTQYVESGR